MPETSHRRERGGGGRPHPAFWLLLVALFGVGGAGCGDPTPEATPGTGTPEATTPISDDTVDDAPSDSLRLRLDVPREVAAGDPVPMRLRVENVAGRALDLYLTGREIAFDLIVESAAGTVAWRRLHDQVIPQILRVEQLAPGDTLVLEDAWDQRSNDGEPVAPGTYAVRGEVLTEDEPLVAGPATLRIVGG